ncbi:cytochrome P450 [Streptomyces sp. NPDC020875]|uniref:cytochrome P450 n=1 Tax=Streptomyces sp. NPDC020875 TaxID=3154898 RepID=UPI0033FB02DE
MSTATVAARPREDDEGPRADGAHAVDPGRSGEPVLTRHLLTARGLQWIGGDRSPDPYALLLRGRPPESLTARLWELPDVSRGALGAVVVARHARAAAALADPRLVPLPPEGPGSVRPVTLADAPRGLGPVFAPAPELLAVPAPDAEVPAAEVPASEVPGGHDAGDPAVREAADRALTAVLDSVRPAGNGELELVTAVLEPVARAVTDPADRRTPREWAALGGLLDGYLCPPRISDARRQTAAVARLREETGGDPDRIRAELLRALTLWASVNLAGYTVALLLAEDRRWRRAGSGDERWLRAAVAEAVRLAPPVRVESRYAREPLEWDGLSVGPGEQVVVVTHAAARDPRVFADPAEFRPDRELPSGAPAVPLGGPAAVVLPTARAVAAAVAAGLARRCPGLRPAGPPVPRARAVVTGALAALPVQLRAQARPGG